MPIYLCKVLVVLFMTSSYPFLSETHRHFYSNQLFLFIQNFLDTMFQQFDGNALDFPKVLTFVKSKLKTHQVQKEENFKV